MFHVVSAGSNLNEKVPSDSYYLPRFVPKCINATGEPIWNLNHSDIYIWSFNNGSIIITLHHFFKFWDTVQAKYNFYLIRIAEKAISEFKSDLHEQI